MRGLLSTIGALAAVLMLAASAGMNFVFLKSHGRSEFEGIVLGSASVSADVLKALLPFFIAWAWRDRRYLAAIPGGAMFVFFTVFSLLSALGFAAANRLEVTGSREGLAATYDTATKEIAEIQTRLSGLPKHRPAKVVQEEIDRTKQNRLWSRSQECKEATARDSRDLCDAYFGLRGELAAAVEGDRLRRTADDLKNESKRLLKAGAGTEADPQVSLLSRLLGRDESTVRNALIVAAALLVELGSGLGLYLATGHSMNGGSEIVADGRAGREQMENVEKLKREVGDMEDWCIARLQPAGGGSLSLVELYGDYVRWCRQLGHQATTQCDFEAGFAEIAIEIGLVKDGMRYAGVRLGDEELDAYFNRYRASA